MSRNRLVHVLVGTVALLVAAAVVYLRPIAPVATGYAATITCGATALQDRTVEDGLGDLPDNPLTPFIRVAADQDGDRVTATLLGLSPSTAERVDGGGCELVTDGGPSATPLAPVVAGPDDLTVATADTVEDGPVVLAESLTSQQASALVDAVDAAFVEDLPVEGAAKGTRAVLVVRGGEVVAEAYAPGFSSTTPLLGWSMTKSWTHALVGVAAHRGLLDPAATDLSPVWTGDDPRRDLSFDDLLTMTSGLAFDEVYDPGTDATTMLFTPVDAGRFAAEQPLVATPGTVWAYSSGTTNIVCDAVEGRTGTASATLLRDLLFEPLSMTSAVVGTDASGDPVCSSFGYATARDWARFGQLYLQDGVWGGERLLPEGWVDLATTPVGPTTDDGDGVTPYGRHWWLNTDADGAVRFPDMPSDAFWASGNEGQQVVVLPSQDAVVVRLGLGRGIGSTEWGLEALVAGVAEALG